jgi:hypothetical protein
MSDEKSFGLGSIFAPLFGTNASAQACEQYNKQLQQAQNFLQGLQDDELYGRVSDWMHSIREID